MNSFRRIRDILQKAALCISKNGITFVYALGSSSYEESVTGGKINSILSIVKNSNGLTVKVRDKYIMIEINCDLNTDKAYFSAPKSCGNDFNYKELFGTSEEFEDGLKIVLDDMSDSVEKDDIKSIAMILLNMILLMDDENSCGEFSDSDISRWDRFRDAAKLLFKNSPDKCYSEIERYESLDEYGNAGGYAEFTICGNSIINISKDRVIDMVRLLELSAELTIDVFKNIDKETSIQFTFYTD